MDISKPSSVNATQRLLILLCVSVPSFMINLDSNIVAVSLSSIARTLGASFADIEWVVSAYTLSFAALLMPAGGTRRSIWAQAPADSRAGDFHLGIFHLWRRTQRHGA